MVGVFSIIVTMTAMSVLRNFVIEQISQMGANTFAVQRLPSVQFESNDWRKYRGRKIIDWKQGRKIMENATLAVNVGIEASFWGGQVETRYAKTPPNVQMLGETPGSFPSRNFNVADGRALVDDDITRARNVCVLGASLAQTVYPFGGAVGESLRMNGISYLVVGVLEPKGGSLAGDQDNFAAIPLTTGLNRFGRVGRSLTIYVQPNTADAYDDTMDQVRGILRTARKVPPGKADDFELFSNDSMMTSFDSFTLIMRLVVAVISSIALLAAGIGIMNIMLVSVTERTREIGIRRAVGARKANIMAQFIIEAIVLCEIGGVIGVVLGVIGGNATAFFLKLHPVVPINWVIIGLVICSAVGIIFGAYPAWKAANLDPIESLRYE